VAIRLLWFQWDESYQGRLKMNTEILTTKKEIQDFVGRPWSIIHKWIIERKFPAINIDGRWESDSELIIEWRRSQIMSRG
jgi:hypothetical protein